MVTTAGPEVLRRFSEGFDNFFLFYNFGNLYVIRFKKFVGYSLMFHLAMPKTGSDYW